MVSSIRTARSRNRVSLPRALSKLGIASRSEARRLILEGRVSVNDRPESNPHRWIDLSEDRIEVDGKSTGKQQPRYLVLNKPEGVITTRADERGRKTVFDLLGEEAKGLLAAGRLDKKSTGLLLFTNDHRLANALTNPERAVEKIYRVQLDRTVTSRALKNLRVGVNIIVEGRVYQSRPAHVDLIDESTILITLTEGKNRQIRKMIESLGFELVSLHRESMAGLGLGGLLPGQFRSLTEKEVKELKSIYPATVSRRRHTARLPLN